MLVIYSKKKKKSKYNTKRNDIENKIATDHDQGKYNTTQEFKKWTSENFSARLVQTNLDIAIAISKWYCYFRKKDRFWW